MAQNNKSIRPPKDLSVPETMKIAALLAELMPPGVGDGSTPVSLDVAPHDSMDESPSALVGSPALQIEDLEDSSHIEAPPSEMPLHSLPQPAVELGRDVPSIAIPDTRREAPTPNAPTTPVALTNTPSQRIVPVAPLIPIDDEADANATAWAPPISDARKSGHDARPWQTPAPEIPPKAMAEAHDEETAVTKLIDSPVPTPPIKQPDEPPASAAPAEPAVASTQAIAPVDPDLIPLGSLSVGGFFSLVNWKNEPHRARHPRRADYGLDEQTLAQASKNPFYVVGQPRRPEERNVSEVLSEIAWE
jgi:hypothetical protein